jgi:hypothetical protein
MRYNPLFRCLGKYITTPTGRHCHPTIFFEGSSVKCLAVSWHENLPRRDRSIPFREAIFDARFETSRAGAGSESVFTLFCSWRINACVVFSRYLTVLEVLNTWATNSAMNHYLLSASIRRGSSRTTCRDLPGGKEDHGFPSLHRKPGG